jgi:hypothetical protein
MWLGGCGESDPGLLNCKALVDKKISCGMLPDDDMLRSQNIQICNNWERTYKEEPLQALDGCAVLSCDEIAMCQIEANQLCAADVSASVDRLCVKAVECQWEDITTDEICQEELGRNQGLYMCLRPDVLEDYVQCVEGITCGPESEDEWYGCNFKHVQGA